MYQRIYYALLLGILISMIPNASAIRCWKCTSQFDVTCGDHFNVTRIRHNQAHLDNGNFGNYGNARQQPVNMLPHVEYCDDRYSDTYKNVCLKRVYKTPHGLKTVSRECRMVDKDFSVGGCPREISQSDENRNLEYCGTCDRDECNAAPGIRGGAFVVLLLALLSFFRL